MGEYFQGKLTDMIQKDEKRKGTGNIGDALLCSLFLTF